MWSDRAEGVTEDRLQPRHEVVEILSTCASSPISASASSNEPRCSSPPFLRISVNAGILKERLGGKKAHTHKDGKIEKDNRCLPYSQQINRTRVWDDINKCQCQGAASGAALRKMGSMTADGIDLFSCLNKAP